MGLSSSQARLLNLTNRMHQIEYKAAKLEAEKLQMANESAKAYEDYLNALEATRLESKKLNSDGSIIYESVTSLSALNAAGFSLVAISAFTLDSSHSYSKGEAITSLPSAIKTAQKMMNLINSGYVVLKDSSGETSVATNTALREVTDETELKKEEAKYEANMKKIDMKDRKFDTELAALDAERNAVKSEMDTLKTVAKENVDRTFKIFS